MNQRCLTILDMLNREETLDVNDLASRLSVSAVTVRKDLAVLENKGLLHRQHGSVMRVSPNDIGYRMTFDYEVKRRIARRALWRVWSILFPLWDVFMGAWLYPRQSGGAIEWGYFVAMLLFVPEYLGLLRYAFGSPELWRAAPPTGSR